MRFLLIALLMLVLVPSVSAVWNPDYTINASLPSIRDPSVFHKDGTLYMIAGEWNGNGSIQPGFNYTGSAWQVDNNINASIVTGFASGANSESYVFYKDGTWYLLLWGNTVTDDTLGFNWTGSAWQADYGINASLHVNAPNVFYKDGTWYAFGTCGAVYTCSFNWTGSAWQADYGINASLPTSITGKTNVFFKDGTWYLLVSQNGFNWTGSAWQADYGINASLSASNKYYFVFEYKSDLYLIGGAPGLQLGFKWNESTTPTVTINSPSGTTTNTTITLNATSEGNAINWYNNSAFLVGPEVPLNSTQLVAHWKLGEGNGNSWISNGNATDSSGNGNNGAINGTEYVQGRFEKGMEFDGSASYINVSDDNTLDINDSFTVSAWIYLKKAAAWNTIVEKESNSGPDFDGYVFQVAQNRIAYEMRNGSSSPRACFLDIAPTIALNTWNYVIARGNKTHLSLWVNGVERGATACTYWQTNSDENVLIGKKKGNNHYFNGTIDEVRIYNRSLSASEILQEYQLANGYYQWNATNTPDGNITFQVNASDSYSNATASSNLIVFLLPDICDTGANELEVFNFQIIDEKTLTNIPSAEFIGATLTLTIGTEQLDFSVFNTSNSSLKICLDNIYLGSSLDLDLTFHNGTGWPVGNWYIRDYEITTNTTTQEVALLNTTYATISYIYLEDAFGNLAKQHFFTLLIYDYNTSQWKELRMAKTDTKGKAVFNLERNTIYYSFYAYDENLNYVKTFDNLVITDLETELALDNTGFNYLSAAIVNIDHPCTDYNTSINCTMTDNNDPPRVTNTTLTLWFAGAVNSSISCVSFDTSNPATVSCAYDPNQTYYWYLDVEMNPAINLDGGVIGTYPQDDYGIQGVFIAGFLSIALGFVGAYNPIVFVLLIFIGFILSQFVGLVSTQSQLTFSFFATMTAIVIWRLKPR